MLCWKPPDHQEVFFYYSYSKFVFNFQFERSLIKFFFLIIIIFILSIIIIMIIINIMIIVTLIITTLWWWLLLSLLSLLLLLLLLLFMNWNKWNKSYFQLQIEETEKIRLDRSSFFNRLGCSFHCEDHVHVQIFSTVQNMIHFIHMMYISMGRALRINK